MVQWLSHNYLTGMLVRLTKYIRLLLVYLHHAYIYRHNIILSITFEGISRVVTLLRITFEGIYLRILWRYIKINHLYVYKYLYNNHIYVHRWQIRWCPGTHFERWLLTVRRITDDDTIVHTCLMTSKPTMKSKGNGPQVPRQTKWLRCLQCDRKFAEPDFKAHQRERKSPCELVRKPETSCGPRL